MEVNINYNFFNCTYVFCRACWCGIQFGAPGSVVDIVPKFIPNVLSAPVSRDGGKRERFK